GPLSRTMPRSAGPDGLAIAAIVSAGSSALTHPAPPPRPVPQRFRPPRGRALSPSDGSRPRVVYLAASSRSLSTLRERPPPADYPSPPPADVAALFVPRVASTGRSRSGPGA